MGYHDNYCIYNSVISPRFVKYFRYKRYFFSLHLRKLLAKSKMTTSKYQSKPILYQKSTSLQNFYPSPPNRKVAHREKKFRLRYFFFNPQFDRSNNRILVAAINALLICLHVDHSSINAFNT